MKAKAELAGSGKPHTRQTQHKHVARRPAWQVWGTRTLALLAPVFGTTSIPQVVQAVKNYAVNLRLAKVPDAAEQAQRWTNPENLACQLNTKPMQVETEQKAKVSVTACPTGDILVKVQPPSSQSFIARWIDVGELTNKAPAANALEWLDSDAFASDGLDGAQIAQLPTAVICQKSIGNGVLLQRVRLPNGTCADQKINTFTGLMESSTPAPCTPNC